MGRDRSMGLKSEGEWRKRVRDRVSLERERTNGRQRERGFVCVVGVEKEMRLENSIQRVCFFCFSLFS